MMLQNLMISHIEMRTEDSPDIVPYTFQRNIEKIVVPLGRELLDIKSKFLQILETFIRRLVAYGALPRRSNTVNPTCYSKYGILQASYMKKLLSVLFVRQISLSNIFSRLATSSGRMRHLVYQGTCLA